MRTFEVRQTYYAIEAGHLWLLTLVLLVLLAAAFALGYAAGRRGRAEQASTESLPPPRR